jgi:hypothetical protein
MRGSAGRLLVAMALLLLPGALQARQPVADHPGAGGDARLPVVAPGLAPGSGMHRWADDLTVQEGPRRQTWRFARYGAIAGAVTGGLAGAWLTLYCSSGNYDGCFRYPFIFGGLGALAGGTAGAIVGAAIPTGGAADPAAPPAAEGPRRAIGSGSLAVGVAGGSVTGWDEVTRMERRYEGTGPVVRASVHAELRPWLALGPEVGQAWLGEAGEVRHIAVAVRVGGRGVGRLSPYATVNLGAYDSQRPSLEYLGMGVGAGVRLTPGGTRRFFADLEARHSRNAQYIEPTRMNGLTFGGGLYW